MIELFKKKKNYRLAGLFKGFIKPDRQKNIYSKTYLN